MSPSHKTSQIMVWKFTLQPWQTAMHMPAGARLLHVNEQRGEVCVWAEVDPEAPTVLRSLLAVPTGGYPGGRTYVGTAHLRESGLAFHVYDGGEVPDD
jgi:hypothetical protein